MRRIPLLPTLFVLAAAAAMIALGVWQLQRAQWKERLLADYAAAAAMPPLDLDPVLARPPEPMPPLAFRRVLVTCSAERIAPDLRAGRSEAGQGGYSYFIPCRPGANGLAGRLRVNAGWSAMPDDTLRLSMTGIVAGRLGADEPDRPLTVTSATAAPPLAPSAAASLETISNNHLVYAFQWFFFAAAALVIYAIALRRRLSPPRAGPTSPRE
jgi:surfeit locus 1 family protein